MSKTYLFYDTETSGINHCFDQILQFAAIRTDENLVPLENGAIEFRIKLRPDIIPSPGALLTTNMPVEQLQEGLTEYEAIQEIHKLCNEPDTISVAYNLFSFDDLMLRFAFYRNLLDPYSHQYKNGCGRLDILPIVTLYYLYMPDILQWPETNGRIKLKLELLNKLNNLAEGDAHDALVDVRVMIALAQRLQQRAPTMWLYCLNFFDQQWVSDQLASAPLFLTDKASHRYPEALLVRSRYGAENNFQRHALHLGYATSKQKRAHWLMLDQTELAKLTDPADFPIRSSQKIDEPPLVVPYSAPRDKRPTAKQELSAQNRAWLQQHPELLPQLAAQVDGKSYEPVVHPIDADANLYSSDFPSEADKKIFQQFHKSTLKAKQRLIPRISDTVRQELATRILFRNYELTLLEESFQALAKAYFRSVTSQGNINPLHDYKGERRTTPYQALAELEQQRQAAALSPNGRAILNGLEKYILNTFIFPTQHEL